MKPKKLDHDGARTRMKELLIAAIQALQRFDGKFFDGWSNSAEAKAVLAFIKKAFGQYVRSGLPTICMTIVDAARALEILRYEDGGFRVDVTGAANREKLAESVCNWWATVPRRYSFVFPMPRVSERLKLEVPIPIGDSARIEKSSFASGNRQKQATIADLMSLKVEKSRREVPAINIEEPGVVLWGGSDEVAIAAAMRTCKVLVILARAVEAAEQPADFEGEKFDSIDCTCIEPREESKRVSVPIGLSQALARSTLTNAVLSPLDAFPTLTSPGRLPSDADIAKDFESRLRSVGIVIDRAREHASLKEKPRKLTKEERRRPIKPDETEQALNAHCERIVTSAAWLFDAEEDGTPARAYVQVAIGFEALYGNSDIKPNLTEALCDRVSFALGESLTDRELLHRKFEHFYDRRSAIVHTGLSTLELDDELLLFWGKETLRRALRRELHIIEAAHDERTRARRTAMAAALSATI